MTDTERFYKSPFRVKYNLDTRLPQPPNTSEQAYDHAVGILYTLEEAGELQWQDRRTELNALVSRGIERLQQKVEQGILTKEAYRVALEILERMKDKGLGYEQLSTLRNLLGEEPSIDLGYDEDTPSDLRE